MLKEGTIIRPPLAAIFLLLGTAVGAVGCVTGSSEVKTARYSLSHPDFWKVKSVAQKDGEPTRITIGKFSDTIITSGEGATQDSVNEASQADIDVWIYAWPAAPAEGEATPEAGSPPAEPTMKVVNRLLEEPDLQLAKQGRIPEQPLECGDDFKRKLKILGRDQSTLDLASRPGHRVIALGAEADGTLLGVISRVPFEQDTNLYCHNLANMRVQLQTLLDGLRLAPAAGTAKAASGGAPPPPS